MAGTTSGEAPALRSGPVPSGSAWRATRSLVALTLAMALALPGTPFMDAASAAGARYGCGGAPQATRPDDREQRPKARRRGGAKRPTAEPTAPPRVEASPQATPSPDVDMSQDEETALLAGRRPATPTGSVSQPIVLGLGPGRTQRERATAPRVPARRSAAATIPAIPAVAGGRVDGVDVSHWNGLVPFEAVRAAGRGFAFIKATQGTTFVDDTFAMQVANARAAGVIVGAYHFYDYRVGGAAQARHLLRTIGPLGEVGGGLPPVVDIECFEPFGAADQAFVRRELRAFVEVVRRRTGRLPIVYTSAHMWRQVTGDDATFGDSPLWVACWSCEAPTLPTGWSGWTFWQTGSVRLAGVPDRIGEDRYVGDGVALAALVGNQAGSVPLVTRRRAMTLRLDGYGAREVRVAVGGEAWGAWTSTLEGVPVRLPDADGRHAIRIQGRARPGVRVPIPTMTVRLDRKAPRIRSAWPLIALGSTGRRADRHGLVADVRTQGLGAGGRVEATARCEHGTVRVPVTGRRDAGSTGARSRRLPVEGVCRLVATARDVAGNVTQRTGAQRWRIVDAGPGPRLADHRAGVFRFRGIGLALVARRGPDEGRVVVVLDGQRLGILDLRDQLATDTQVVLSIGGLDARSTHTLRLRTITDGTLSASWADITSILVIARGAA